jgi:hypothetical protein
VQDSQHIWSDYHARKKAERLREAERLWSTMHSAGVRADTVLALDFTCFGPSAANAQALAAQLGENYEVRVSPDKQAGYHLVTGTTRPHGMTLEAAQHTAWVEFMADVARSHGCVFSEWSLEAPALATTFRSSEAGGDD